jgi:hypothetical protein
LFFDFFQLVYVRQQPKGCPLQRTRPEAHVVVFFTRSHKKQQRPAAFRLTFRTYYNRF